MIKKRDFFAALRAAFKKQFNHIESGVFQYKYIL